MDGPTFHLSQADAVAWLRALPSESVDLLVTDPPYESLEKHRAIGTTTRLKHSKASSNDWFSIFPNARFPELFTEVHRVLRRNSHFYLFCDPETMFVAKPLAEQAGFKFWKPLIWDKCLGPDTLVWTERGTQRIADIVVGDRVAIPEGGSSEVRATRRTRAPARKLVLSDGTELVASHEHRFMLGDGGIRETGALVVGDVLAARPVRQRTSSSLRLDDVIPLEEAVLELPDTHSCLWCRAEFESNRAAAAHQARHCVSARSKLEMAIELGLKPKRLRRWMSRGRIPRAWAIALGIEDKVGARVQCHLQNDVERWYPKTIELDYDLGRFVGLFAAEGSFTASGVTFAFHADEKHLHRHVASYARYLGARAYAAFDGNTCSVHADFKVVQHLMRWFVGGTDARSKYLRPSVYSAPDEFRRGVLAGLEEGDGHWSFEEQRHTFVSSSADLAAFVQREHLTRGGAATMRPFDNQYGGGWKVRHDPVHRDGAIAVEAIVELGEQELVDISIADRDELFLLGNGVITHNCSIGMGYHYRARYECVLFFEKGKRKLADLGIADIIEAKRINGGYPAEKPSSVSEVLIRQSTDPGQLIVDPFMGSGSVGLAAVSSGRNFLGNDLCAEAVGIARARLLEAGAREVEAPKAAAEVGQLGLL